MICNTYNIMNEQLREVECVRDLGIMLDKGITFKHHIAGMTQKAKRTLGFIVRNSRNFKNIQTLRVLYFSLVRSGLEFGSLVWNPHSVTTSESIEKIQKRFLKFLYLKTFEYYPTEIEYEELLRGFEVYSLDKRRAVASLLFLHDILKGRIQEEDLLSKININVPRVNGRWNLTFRPPVSRTNVLKSSVINRACNLYNAISSDNPDLDLDIFHQNRNTFRKTLLGLSHHLFNSYSPELASLSSLSSSSSPVVDASLHTPLACLCPCVICSCTHLRTCNCLFFFFSFAPLFIIVIVTIINIVIISIITAVIVIISLLVLLSLTVLNCKQWCCP